MTAQATAPVLVWKWMNLSLRHKKIYVMDAANPCWLFYTQKNQSLAFVDHHHNDDPHKCSLCVLSVCIQLQLQLQEGYCSLSEEVASLAWPAQTGNQTHKKQNLNFPQMMEWNQEPEMSKQYWKQDHSGWYKQVFRIIWTSQPFVHCSSLFFTALHCSNKSGWNMTSSKNAWHWYNLHFVSFLKHKCV